MRDLTILLSDKLPYFMSNSPLVAIGDSVAHRGYKPLKPERERIRKDNRRVESKEKTWKARGTYIWEEETASC
jgi:hypothetical protein